MGGCVLFILNPILSCYIETTGAIYLLDARKMTQSVFGKWHDMVSLRENTSVFIAESETFVH